MLLTMLPLYLVFPPAECPKPGTNGNIVLTNDALLMNDFPEGSEVTLECATGYEIESGSGVINCIDGKWTKPDLTCRSESCQLYLQFYSFIKHSHPLLTAKQLYSVFWGVEFLA